MGLDIAMHNLDRLIVLLQNHTEYYRVRSASRWSNIGWEVQEPYLNEFEISYTLTGTRNMIIQHHALTCKPGDIVFWSSNNLGSCASGYYSYYSIIFESTDPKSNPTFLQAMHEYFDPLVAFSCPAEQRHAMEALFLDACFEMSTAQRHNELNVKLSILKLFISLQRMLGQQTADTSLRKYPKDTEIVANMIGYLSMHLDRPITLQELGDKYQLNPRYLNRIFKRVTGYPILQYMKNMKIEKAKKLLLTHSMNQLEIALELGWDSSHYFNHVFKKETGMTPLQYRKKIKNYRASGFGATIETNPR